MRRPPAGFSQLFAYFLVCAAASGALFHQFAICLSVWRPPALFFINLVFVLVGVATSGGFVHQFCICLVGAAASGECGGLRRFLFGAAVCVLSSICSFPGRCGDFWSVVSSIWYCSDWCGGLRRLFLVSLALCWYLRRPPAVFLFINLPFFLIGAAGDGRPANCTILNPIGTCPPTVKNNAEYHC